MKKSNNEKYYLIEVISSMSTAKNIILFIKENNVTLDEVFDELIKNVENSIDLTEFDLET